jgi:hypothetical protein
LWAASELCDCRFRSSFSELGLADDGAAVRETPLSELDLSKLVATICSAHSLVLHSRDSASLFALRAYNTD